jgi:hypothetical protein
MISTLTANVARLAPQGPHPALAALVIATLLGVRAPEFTLEGEAIHPPG